MDNRKWWIAGGVFGAIIIGLLGLVVYMLISLGRTTVPVMNQAESGTVEEMETEPVTEEEETIMLKRVVIFHPKDREPIITVSGRVRARQQDCIQR